MDKVKRAAGRNCTGSHKGDFEPECNNCRGFLAGVDWMREAIKADIDRVIKWHEKRRKNDFHSAELGGLRQAWGLACEAPGFKEEDSSSSSEVSGG